jgi:hypothetical protein
MEKLHYCKKKKMQATRAQRSQRMPSCSTRILTLTYGSEGAELLENALVLQLGMRLLLLRLTYGSEGAELLENAMDLRALLGSCFETCGAGGLVSAMTQDRRRWRSGGRPVGIFCHSISLLSRCNTKKNRSARYVCALLVRKASR